MNLWVVLLASCWLFGTFVKALDDDDTDEHWEHFKIKYGKTYDNEKEEDEARDNFEENMLHSALHNLKDEHNYTKEVNAFSDMDLSEAIEILCGTDIPEDEDPAPRKNYLTERLDVDAIDWKENGVVTNVKDQGQCGSCWSFAAIQAIESQNAIVHNDLTELSVQEPIDCSYTSGNTGCNGGWPTKAYKYVEKSGIGEEKCYPYTGLISQFCRRSSGCKTRHIKGFENVDPSGNENALAQAVATRGPISVAICANKNFMNYKSGVFHDSSCNCKVNHAVLVVGYGTDKDAGDYWLVKNSWGTEWGENGYIRMARNADNMCHIASHGSYPIMK